MNPGTAFTYKREKTSVVATDEVTRGLTVAESKKRMFGHLLKALRTY